MSQENGKSSTCSTFFWTLEGWHSRTLVYVERPCWVGPGEWCTFIIYSTQYLTLPRRSAPLLYLCPGLVILYIILYRTVTLPLGYLLSGRWYRGAPHRQFHQIIAAYRVSTTCNKYVHASLFSHMVRVIVAMPQYGGALQPALRPVQPGWIYFFSIVIDTMCIL